MADPDRAPSDDHRSVTLERLDTGVYRATNARGGEVTFGSRAGAGFTPVEMMLAAIGGCSAVDVDVVTQRRSPPDRFEVQVEADKVRDDVGNLLDNVVMTYRVSFPAGPDGDRARDMLPRAAKASHDRTCTVSRTIEAGTPVAVRIEE